jgi:dihydrofolate synthase/folylpolyglutamate synthase
MAMTMTYREAVQYLYSLGWQGTKLGLDKPLRLAALAGQPQNQLRFLHVAGTNGKGSTCAMLESIYRAAGYRVGLFTSPHLVSFRERIQVNRRLIPEADVVRLVGRLRGWVDSFPADDRPTFFEAVTVMALVYFAQQKCDVVVWETGLGGRLDATNIVTPLASIITNVQFDHQQWLGNTLAQIAAEKAGIIKPGVPVLTAAAAAEALAVIVDRAHRLRAPLTLVTAQDTQQPPLDRIELPLLGEHQRLNAALAVATVCVVSKQLPVPETALWVGLETVEWPGRFQLVRRPSGQAVLLDGAHNPGGAETLRATFQKYFPTVRPALVLGVMQDKDRDTMCRILAPLADRIFTVPVDSPRSASPEAMAALCRRHNPAAEVVVCPTLADALIETAWCRFVLVTGSLHLLGEAMELLGLAAVPARSERGLNEWNAARQLQPVSR